MEDTKTLKLRAPIEFAQRTWDALDLREPTAGEFKRIESMGGTEATIELVRQVAAVPLSVVEALGARDLKAARDYLQAFCVAAKAPEPLEEAMVLGLRQEITVDDGTLFSLSLREPTAGELRKIDTLTGMAEVATLIGLITGAPLSTVWKIGMRDYRLAEAYLLGFL